MMLVVDMTGRTLGMWHVLSRDKTKTQRAYWICKCTECGVEQSVAGTELRRSDVKGGCRSCRRSGYASKYPAEYRVWSNVKTRVFNPQRRNSSFYNSIGMHEAWANSFELFFHEVGPRPSPQHSLDRSDNSRGYFPGNVRWATPKEQARNTSRNLMVGSECLLDYAVRAGVPYNTLRDRFHKAKATDQRLAAAEQIHDSQT